MSYVQSFKKFTKKAEKLAEQSATGTTGTTQTTFGAIPEQFKSKADEIKNLEQNIIDAKAKILQQEQDLQNKKNALNTEIANYNAQQAKQTQAAQITPQA